MAKRIIARICLAVAVVVFFLGTMMLCSCPGDYAVAVVFAVGATLLGERKIRVWGGVSLIASLAMMIRDYIYP
jgi:hypothetical protein